MSDCDRALYVIAEISANHRQRKDVAIEIIEAAAVSGADAVKFQHYKPETITVRSGHPDFRISGGTLWDGRQLYDLYEEAVMPWEWTGELVEVAGRVGLDWLSSPFDPTAVDFLERFDIPMYKVASFELVDLPLVEYIASKGKPMIMSTGMATVGEIDAAVRTARSAGSGEITLLRCNSGYPASPTEMDLVTIPVMRDLWGLPVGLSDHTQTSTSAVVAVALGATVIEKHLTLRRSDGGADAGFSAEPDEFAELVQAVREASQVLGSVRLEPSDRELTSVKFRRSLRAVLPIRSGEMITSANVRSVRPAGGLPAIEFRRVEGLRVTRDIAAGEPIDLSCVAHRQ